jgi:hypothetical protein
MLSPYPEEIVIAIPFKMEYEKDYLYHDTDYVAAKRHLEHYKLEQTPLRTPDIAIGDIVKVVYENGEYFFNGIMEESGYSSVRVGIVCKPLLNEITGMINSLEAEIVPIHGPDSLTINISSSVDYAPLKEYLLAEKQKGNIVFWETCIRKNHFHNIRTMNKFNFWEIIDESYSQSKGDKDQQVALLIRLLQDYSTDEIIEFEKIFRELIIEADTYKVMAALKIIEGWVSDDSYLYFRSWLISRGRTLFREVVENPDYLANYDLSDNDVEFEALMYVATNAYRQKTGKEEEDDSFPRGIALEAGLDYDYGAPPTKGTDWTEEDLPALLPRLWQKYPDR